MISQFAHQHNLLTYETFGNPANPSLLMIHGCLSHRGVWRQTIPALQERYYCVAPDLLGLGDSAKPADGDYSIRAQAERVLALADHLGFERFNLIGHSMGGQVVTSLAANLAPQRVVKLVSVDGVVTGKLMPKVRDISYRLVCLAALYPPLMKLSGRLANWKPYAKFLLQAWFYRIDSIPYESWEIDRRMSTRFDIAISGKKAWDGLQSCNLTDDLPKVCAPSLAIFGRQDGTVPLSDGELFQRQVPGARLSVIKDCGHFPMYEKTGEYLQRLVEFL